MIVISFAFRTEDIFADNFKQDRCGSSFCLPSEMVNLNNNSNNLKRIRII